MSSLAFLLRKLFSDESDYCCLCFTSLVGQDTTYNIGDEISINVDKSEDLYEIISTVLGDEVLNNLATKTLCRHCTERTISCYKFIQRCKANINKLQSLVHSFEHSAIEVKEETNYETLFISFLPNTYKIDLYYDINKKNHDLHTQFLRFQHILEEKKVNVLNIQFETDHSDDNGKKDSNGFHPLQLSDIIHDKNDLQNFKCKLCLKQYQTGIKLKQHYLRVHAPKDYKCSQCPRSFGSMFLLKRHIKDSHCTAVCSQCGKMYTNKYSLRHHEQSHKRRHVCQTCGKIYKGKQAFNNHITLMLCKKMRKSNAEATFVCDYCGKKYSQKTALRVHIRLEHENGKSVTCEWCSKKFSSISRLNDHIIKHTKAKNFECETCGGKFVSKASLLYHTRTHTGEKPYQCEHCDLAFLSASRRSEHVKRHHTSIIYECDICHNKLKSNTCLLRHRKKHFDISSRLYHKPQDADKVFNYSV